MKYKSMVENSGWSLNKTHWKTELQSMSKEMQGLTPTAIWRIVAKPYALITVLLTLHLLLHWSGNSLSAANPVQLVPWHISHAWSSAQNSYSINAVEWISEGGTREHRKEDSEEDGEAAIWVKVTLAPFLEFICGMLVFSLNATFSGTPFQASRPTWFVQWINNSHQLP